MPYNPLVGARITRAGLDGGVVVIPQDIQGYVGNTAARLARPGEETFFYCKVITGTMKLRAGDSVPNVIAAVDQALEILTLTTLPLVYRTGHKVRVTNSGGALPTPLAANTDYFIILVDAALGKIQLATTAANADNGVAINLTSAGTGVNSVGQMPPVVDVSHTDGFGGISVVPADGIIKFFAPFHVSVIGSAGTDAMEYWWA